MHSIYVIVTIALFGATLSAADYCNLRSCRRKGPHTMCAYPGTFGPECGANIVTFGLSNADKAEIVRKHNELRSFVAAGRETRGSPGPQPGARNMQTMTWDDELATIAQRWANQCHIGHDKCRDIPSYQVGQSIGYRSVKGVKNSYSPSDVIQAWYNEVALVDRNTVSTGLDKYDGVGHYTQIIWATTTKVGCGRVTYFEDDGWESYYLVCNYGPAGNWRNRQFYEVA